MFVPTKVQKIAPASVIPIVFAVAGNRVDDLHPLKELLDHVGFVLGEPLNQFERERQQAVDDRETSLSRLAKGELDAVCAVDMFNEGTAIDRVVMLRPTESSVVFLQQLGRGLRANEGKAAVIVIDFI